MMMMRISRKNRTALYHALNAAACASTRQHGDVAGEGLHEVTALSVDLAWKFFAALEIPEKPAQGMERVRQMVVRKSASDSASSRKSAWII